MILQAGGVAASCVRSTRACIVADHPHPHGVRFPLLGSSVLAPMCASRFIGYPAIRFRVAYGPDFVGLATATDATRTSSARLHAQKLKRSSGETYMQKVVNAVRVLGSGMSAIMSTPLWFVLYDEAAGTDAAAAPASTTVDLRVARTGSS